jgi:hypothetical protein
MDETCCGCIYGADTTTCVGNEDVDECCNCKGSDFPGCEVVVDPCDAYESGTCVSSTIDVEEGIIYIVYDTCCGCVYDADSVCNDEECCRCKEVSPTCWES